MSTTTRTTTSGAALALATVVLAACGAGESVTGPDPSQQADADRLTAQALTYVGDPWEKRYRARFWADQHFHDSWNRCHLGENAPRPRGCDGTSLTPRG